MEDKYQQAFDLIKSSIEYDLDEMQTEECKKKYLLALDTIQELINNYEKIEKALYKACFIVNEQFDGCYHCENKRCTTVIDKVVDCGIKNLIEYLLKESEKK